MFSTAKKRLVEVRIKPKFALMFGLGLLIVLRPLLVVLTLVFAVVLTTAVFLIMGHEAFWKGVVGLARRYAKRHPDRAARMHRRLDAFAMKWDQVLDIFPDGTVENLYMPDFSEVTTAESRHDKVLDRRFATLKES